MTTAVCSAKHAMICTLRGSLKTLTRVCKPIKLSRIETAAMSLSSSSPAAKTSFASKGGCRQPQILKLQSEELKSIYTPELTALSDLFKKHGYPLRIAGGAVRDLLMGKKPHDLDFATTATPEQMKEMFEEEMVRMINTKGEKHGTITPRINDKENFEVTTLRIDVTTDGRHAEVQFTTDWELDANRRDLTINCLFMDLDGTVYDYFNGIQDIKDKRVVFVGDANTRIIEDYLRILRYFRFYGRIASTADCHDENCLEAIRKNMEGLAKISGERIWSELRKILEGNFSGELLKTMIDAGIAPHIGLPEEPDMEEFDKVWQKTRDLKLHGITRLVSLLKNQNEVMQLHARLKLSAFERDMAQFIVEHRQISPAVDPLKPYQILVMQTKFKISDCKEWCVQLLMYRGETQLAEKMAAWQMPRFPVNGQMLKERQMPRGKKFGMLLDTLKQRWIQSDFTLTTDELLLMLPDALSEINDKETK